MSGISDYLYVLNKRNNMNNHLGFDKNGVKIFEGATVNVPDPNQDDIHEHAFQGTVSGRHEQWISVEDQEGEFYDIEEERLEVQE